MSMLPEPVARFRQSHRAMVPRWYSGTLHFAFTTLGTLAALVFSVAHVHEVKQAEWLTLPLGFLFANFVEYRAHRGPMHHPPASRINPLGIVYRRHAGQHHRFYTDKAMAAESTRDFHMVLFPPAMLVFFIGCHLVPVGLLLSLLLSRNVAWLFAAMGLGYFLLYEWLHLSYHLPEGSPIGRLPLVLALKRHHLVHHDPQLMTRWNFNITFPIFDVVYGTQQPPPAVPPTSLRGGASGST